MASPELIAQNDVFQWALSQGWWLERYDSKATFSKAKGAYSRNSGIRTGTPDLGGCDKNGLCVWIEMKAPEKENVCRLEQRQFLERSILNNAFGVVVSSREQVSQHYYQWLALRGQSLKMARDYLLSSLPKKVVVDKKIITLVL